LANVLVKSGLIRKWSYRS